MSASDTPDARDPLEAALHDLTNRLSAAHSYTDVILLRSKSNAPRDGVLIDNLLRELDHANETLQSLRRTTYRAGDTLRCTQCNYVFVHRKAAGKGAACRRCKGTKLERWKP